MVSEHEEAPGVEAASVDEAAGVAAGATGPVSADAPRDDVGASPSPGGGSAGGAPEGKLRSLSDGARGGVEFIGQALIDGVNHLGKLILMVIEVIKVSVRPPYRVRLLFEAMEEVGVGSLFIVLLTGLFTGMVMSLQIALSLRDFNAETLVGGTVAMALGRELAPVLSGLMVSGRSGSAMATTLGTMRVSEQIDAMEVMAVSSLQYLVMPRILATIVMMPLLTLLFDFVGMAGAYLVAVETLGVDGGLFMDKIKDFIWPSDIVKGAIKGAFFGATIATLSCYRGYYASGGAKGVGEATTSAVVWSSISILVLNYFLDLIMWPSG